jgi:hypothetical protein
MLITDKHLKEIREIALLIYNEEGITLRNASNFLALCYLKATIRFCKKHQVKLEELEFELPTKPKQDD